MPEIFDNGNCWVKCSLLGVFGACFISKMDHQAVTGDNDNGKSIDDSKITGGIPPNVDKKVVSDEALVDFAINS